MGSLAPAAFSEGGLGGQPLEEWEFSTPEDEGHTGIVKPGLNVGAPSDVENNYWHEFGFPDDIEHRRVHWFKPNPDDVDPGDRHYAAYTGNDFGANHATQACTDCHNDEAGLTAAHSNRFDAKSAASLVALTKTKIDPETCYACHGSMEELTAKTADSTVLTDENGKAVNPHDLPEGHFGTNVDCGSCHKMHGTVDTATSAQNSCMTCHHNNVYECGTCHDV